MSVLVRMGRIGGRPKLSGMMGCKAPLAAAAGTMAKKQKATVERAQRRAATAKLRNLRRDGRTDGQSRGGQAQGGGQRAAGGQADARGLVEAKPSMGDGRWDYMRPLSPDARSCVCVKRNGQAGNVTDQPQPAGGV